MVQEAGASAEDCVIMTQDDRKKRMGFIQNPDGSLDVARYITTLTDGRIVYSPLTGEEQSDLLDTLKSKGRFRKWLEIPKHYALRASTTTDEK